MKDKYPFQATAWDLVEEYHKGQRYGKQLYTFHLSQVCEGVRRATTKLGLGPAEVDAYCAAAILHDIIEDSSCNASVLIDRGLPMEVVEAVIALTKQKDYTYEYYMHKVLSNWMATVIKREDTMMNLTQSQHEGNAKRVVKYTKQLGILYGSEAPC